jgi:choline dehydrogenase-like flavoprotein
MDINALTTDWLDAVRRVRSASYQHFVQQVPQAKVPRQERTLTDAIESALHDAGAKTVQLANRVTGSAATGSTPAQLVDRLV